MALILFAGTVIALFTLAGILLLKLESRPSKQSKAYFNWHARDRAIRQSVDLSWKEGNWS